MILDVLAHSSLQPLPAGVLFGVQPTDPTTFSIVALTMIGVAVLACLIPGLRALNVDPAIALRHD
jgi:putative ABC transport system permease protein